MSLLHTSHPLRALVCLTLMLSLAACGRATQATNSATANGPATGPALAASATTAPAKSEISIDNFAFTPAALTVAAGETVTWTNHDDVPHTVTANDHSFDSNALDTDKTFSHKFAAPGTYPYYCKVHPHMTGQIIVK